MRKMSNDPNVRREINAIKKKQYENENTFWLPLQEMRMFSHKYSNKELKMMGMKKKKRKSNDKKVTNERIKIVQTNVKGGDRNGTY